MSAADVHALERRLVKEKYLGGIDRLRVLAPSSVVTAVETLAATAPLPVARCLEVCRVGVHDAACVVVHGSLLMAEPEASARGTRTSDVRADTHVLRRAIGPARGGAAQEHGHMFIEH